MGYKINPEKCEAICIKNGVLSELLLIINSDTSIKSLEQGQTIKYLGVNFSNVLTFKRGPMIKEFGRSLQNLVSTPLLRADQKIQIINQYLWPQLIFPLQTAPLNQLPKSFLNDLDFLVKSTAKQIIGLPKDTPDAMIYTSHSYRGLQVMRASWEARIQHFNVF